MKTRFSTKEITMIGILSAMGFALMFLELGIPIFPAFLKVDFSDIPVLIATFLMGPVAGVLTALIKNLLHLTRTSTVGIGELANFIVNLAYVLPAAYIYKRRQDFKGLIHAMIVGVISMAVIGTLGNYFIFLPLYAQFAFHCSVQDFVGYAGIPFITNLPKLLVLGILPFNLFKGTVVSMMMALVYSKVSSLINRKSHEFQG